MSDPVASRLDSLPKLTNQALVDLWRRLFKQAPPNRLRRDVMIPILAHKIQEDAYGGLSAEHRRRLKHFASRPEADHAAAGSFRPGLQAGTRLVREWKGQIHTVQVGDRGYEYKGRRWASLSKIAREITGTRWSGPLFFGLKTAKGTKGRPGR